MTIRDDQDAEPAANERAVIRPSVSGGNSLAEYVDRLLKHQVELYEHYVLLHGNQLADLPPSGLASRIGHFQPELMEARFIIAKHLRSLRARPRPHIPPALLLTLTAQETPWPRSTA
ncbi:hypothetical protein ACIBHY_29755 [Nonomuraea sp. NPDC050547]|uniref:hypothetical protein n=1 Tax=Nonomuraea sp. NPDC050547 TaxID=3364368 RepID=UPI0037AFDD8F